MSPQEIFLQLIEAAGEWNAFDGPAIAHSLRENRELWRAAILCEQGYHFTFDLEGNVTGMQIHYAVLRGLPEDTVFLDTIRITPSPGLESRLEELAESWVPDTMKWLSFEDASSAHSHRDEAGFKAAGYDPQKAVLEAWWD